MIKPSLKALTVLALTVPSGVAAQSGAATSPTSIWGFGALGVGATGTDSTFYAAGAGLALQRGPVVALARIAAVGPGKENHYEDLGFLVGLGSGPGRFHMLGAVGFGLMHDALKRTSLTVPVEVQATLRTTPWLGVGARGFLSINGRSTFGGLSLIAEVGRLKP